MPATLDTNLLLRLALHDVPRQYAAVKALVTAPGAHYRVTDTAISEMVHALAHHYCLTREQIADIVRAVILDPSIDTHKDFIEGVIEYFLDHPALSYIDCYLAEEARISGNTPLLTFDKKLAAQHPAAEILTPAG